jgi:hypothetical protein
MLDVVGYDFSSVMLHNVDTSQGYYLMKKKRIPISPELEAKVMFASDRTCCVCRLEKQKVQIHHIDENPSNNDFDNLAVMCINCHNDTLITGGFIRKLTPDLVRRYNSSWRDIVKLRLTPQVEDAGQKELAVEALFEANLDCEFWKAFFVSLAKLNLQGAAEEYGDYWEIIEQNVPKYSEETYANFRPLFVEGTHEMQSRFDRLVQIFPDVLPYDFRANLVRGHRQLEAVSTGYMALGAQLVEVLPPDVASMFFYTLFAEIIRVLRDISRDANRRRESLVIPK